MLSSITLPDSFAGIVHILAQPATFIWCCPGKWRKYDASTVNHVHLIMIFYQMVMFSHLMALKRCALHSIIFNFKAQRLNILNQFRHIQAQRTWTFARHVIRRNQAFMPLKSVFWNKSNENMLHKLLRVSEVSGTSERANERVSEKKQRKLSISQHTSVVHVWIEQINTHTAAGSNIFE